MKRFISLYTLLLFILVSCNGPVGQLDQNSDSSPENLAPEVTYNPSATLGDSLRQAAWEQFQTHNGSKWKNKLEPEKRNTAIGVFRNNRIHSGTSGTGRPEVFGPKPVPV